MDSIVGKQIVGVLILFLLIIPTHGCLILPIPTPGHGGYDVITQESIASLEPEKATRADVLLKIGDPAERWHQDRFFVYSWELKHGYLLVVIGYAAAGIRPVTGNHFLLIEFLPDNRIKRSKFTDAGIFSQPARKQLDELINEWRQSSSDS
jgi:hypothetical protein